MMFGCVNVINKPALMCQWCSVVKKSYKPTFSNLSMMFGSVKL